jgi:hypothetical protein
MAKRYALLIVVLFALAVLTIARPNPEPQPVALEFTPPKNYVCYRASGPITIDGKLDEAAWKDAPWTDDFADIEGPGKPKPRFRTRAKMLWDDENLYIAAELEEPHVQGSFTKHDSYIFHEDQDFEVFLGPNGDNHLYAELEMNALNTTWDLLLTMPYRDGGHAIDAWDIRGLKTAVHVNGTINNPADIDKGWTIEIAWPWKGLKEIHNYKQVIPNDGDQWRINFSRVEGTYEIANGAYRKIKTTPEDNWVWSPQGAINMHMPEKWGYLQFGTAKPGSAAFRPDPAGPARELLHRIYYAQQKYRKEHERWAKSFDELKFPRYSHESFAGLPVLETAGEGFEASVPVKWPDGTTKRWRIRQDSRIWETK